MGIHRYELGARIGFGGMAEVFRAWSLDAAGNRTGAVVVKRILPHLSADPDYREMFIDEAKIAATLDHRNIVKLLDLGRMDGQLFLALELVEGADLEKLLRRMRAGGLRFPFAISAWIVAELLFALHHAHTRVAPDGRPLALVHRDVTPSNVLISKAGDVKLSDFGVAKAVVRAGRTVAGVVKGNTMYMAPEQILGNPVDPRADVYSAGLLLLCLLTGKHPFEGMPLGMLIDRTLAGAIPRASEMAPDVPLELEEVVIKATTLDTKVRFESCAMFLEALSDACAKLELRAGSADLARVVERLLAGGAEIGAPAEPSIVGRLDALIAGAIEPTPLPEPELEHFDTYRGPIQVAAHEGIEATPSTPQVDAAMFAGDERTPSWNVESTVFEPSPESELEEATVLEPHQDPELGEPTILGAIPAGDFGDEAVENTPVTHLPIEAFTLPGAAPFTAAPAPAGILRGHRQAVSSLALIGTGALALSASLDQSLRIWEVASREERVVLKGHRAAVTAVAVTPDGRLALSGSRDRTVRLWDLRDAREAGALEGHDGWIFAVAMDAAGRVAISAGMDRAIRVWNLERAEAARILWGHADTISALALFNDGRRALSGSYDRTVKLWDVEHGHEIASLECENSVRAIAVSPDGRRAVSGGADTMVTLWDLERGLALRRLGGHHEPVVALAFSRDGRLALSGSYDGSARVWDVETGRDVKIFQGAEPVMSVAFSPDDAFVLAGRADGTIELWGMG